MSWPLRRSSLIAALAGATLAPWQPPTAPPTLVRHAVVIDGSGGPARRADVRISGDRIVAVGQFAPQAGERVVDAEGRTLAPGFIDTHSHHDRGLDTARDALA